MLTEILATFEAEPAGLCSDDIAHRLGAEPSAVEGMLETLVRMGKLVEAVASETCNACHAHSMCLAISNARLSFTLPSRTPVDRVILQSSPG
jgi:hypothetical protein